MNPKTENLSTEINRLLDQFQKIIKCDMASFREDEIIKDPLLELFLHMPDADSKVEAIYLLQDWDIQEEPHKNKQSLTAFEDAWKTFYAPKTCTGNAANKSENIKIPIKDPTFGAMSCALGDGLNLIDKFLSGKILIFNAIPGLRRRDKYQSKTGPLRADLHRVMFGYWMEILKLFHPEKKQYLPVFICGKWINNAIPEIEEHWSAKNPLGSGEFARILGMENFISLPAHLQFYNIYHPCRWGFAKHARNCNIRKQWNQIMEFHHSIGFQQAWRNQ